MKLTALLRHHRLFKNSHHFVHRPAVDRHLAIWIKFQIKYLCAIGAIGLQFLERLIAVALPRIRDFKGVSSKFDGRGNYTMGITEQIIFPEIDIDKISKIMGLEITFVTSAGSDEEGTALLKAFGIPFRNDKK